MQGGQILKYKIEMTMMVKEDRREGRDADGRKEGKEEK